MALLGTSYGGFSTPEYALQHQEWQHQQSTPHF
jgi:hypothetical protein